MAGWAGAEVEEAGGTDQSRIVSEFLSRRGRQSVHTLIVLLRVDREHAGIQCINTMAIKASNSNMCVMDMDVCVSLCTCVQEKKMSEIEIEYFLWVFCSQALRLWHLSGYIKSQSIIEQLMLMLIIGSLCVQKCMNEN